MMVLAKIWDTDTSAKRDGSNGKEGNDTVMSARAGNYINR